MVKSSENADTWIPHLVGRPKEHRGRLRSHTGM